MATKPWVGAHCCLLSLDLTGKEEEEDEKCSKLTLKYVNIAKTLKAFCQGFDRFILYHIYVDAKYNFFFETGMATDRKKIKHDR